jgi:hypothetical protein
MISSIELVWESILGWRTPQGHLVLGMLQESRLFALSNSV